MTATFEVGRAGRARAPHLTDQEVGRLRALLIAQRDDLTGQLAEYERLLVELGEPGADVEGVELELVGLHAARARDTVEEIDHALIRLGDGSYGTCEGCARPVPFERLEVIPRARFCVACPPTSAFQR